MNRTGNILIILAIVLAVAIGTSLYIKTKQASLIQFKQNTTPTVQPSEQKEITEDEQLKSYKSRDLKISFRYSKEWFLDEQYPMILLTNYKTNLNRDDKPNNDQIEILLSNFSGCFSSIEENLIDPACGEGGLAVKKNEILSKETKQTSGGTFYKYLIATPKGNRLTYYLLEKDGRVLQLSKQPDPSQFEKEFEEIIDSIEFL